mmetsp:Transcript_49644/g.98166  ORF Transcript_49644/g.98166 Transcript_49644/m.98166 type:complete len:289 (+) Transcript_49644:70-936(+)
MLRVRNSFLEFQPTAPRASLRSRSTEAPSSRPTPLRAIVQDIVCDRLNEVLYSGLHSTPFDLRPALQPGSDVVVPQAPNVVKPERDDHRAALKQVLSNNSVSTMAPDDSDELFDEITNSEGREQHYGIGLKSFQHVRVPRSLNLAEEFQKTGLEGPPTTMMIRNIPNRYSQRELIREIENLGFHNTFDFFYAPIDTGTMGNVGYAFINFVHPAWAERCQQIVTGYIFKKHQQKARRKIATVSVAHLQGLQANIRHYENAAVNGRNRSKRCGPVIMTSIANIVPPEAQA